MSGRTSDEPPAGAAVPREPWWHAATGYQIYPASFCDSNGDGVGDIPGILSKLDYLQALGIGFIWLSPVYASPMVDNGYDISDYRAIHPGFGTLADMDRLIAEARARGIGIVMDLVVNHTSEEHPWFLQARSGRSSPYRDFYLWRDPSQDGAPPNALMSAFGGPAWTFDEPSGQYYCHLFAAAQPDLDWGNPRVRESVYEMMAWWLARGIAGFRMDVIDLVGKDVDRCITANGPSLHDHLREMHAAVLGGRDCVTVGEAWSATPQDALLYSGVNRRELSMVFQFEHVRAFWDERLGKWAPKPVDLVTLKGIFERWQTALARDGWNSLFWGNHDLPRAVSRYGHDGEHRVASARMLATVLHLMKGTPFIYQGEEIGMTNAGFDRIEQHRDVETLNHHRELRLQGLPEDVFLAGARASSRDNARTPMQWDAGPHAGFTTGSPWIAVNRNHVHINAAADADDPDGVFQRYQRLIALRKDLPVIRHGDFKLIAREHPAIFAYRREYAGATLTVIANFTASPATLALDTDTLALEGRDLFSGRRHRIVGRCDLAPCEVLALLR